MRLITHNLLSCHASQPSQPCTAPNNFPLVFQDVSNLEIVEAELNVEFLQNMLLKIDYPALVTATRQLGQDCLPDTPPDVGTSLEPSEEQLQALQKLHHALLEIHVLDGNMVCPSCKHVYAIKDGIPNMLLAEHEIRR